MTKFDREQALANYLLHRLSLDATDTSDPNATGKETGIDLLVRLSDGRLIGIQVTEVDPYDTPGKARKKEKHKAKAVPEKRYGMYAQNDRRVVVDAITRSIRRKVETAERHSFDHLDEAWLLICAGIPELGTAASSFAMTPPLSAEDMGSATDSILNGSKYSRCFFLPILGAERGFYRWEKATGWKKSVQLEDIHSLPRSAYVQSLLDAPNQQEFDRLLHEECQLVLQEIRQGSVG
jgi:hypothetical protein